MAHTGENAPKKGTYTCASCEKTVDMDQGESLPPCPSERKAVEWQEAGQARSRSGR
jgi:hypothetical protein